MAQNTSNVRKKKRAKSLTTANEKEKKFVGNLKCQKKNNTTMTEN